MVGGVTVPAFSSITLKLVDGKPEENSVFSLDDNSLETPFASVKFADNGTISSFVDKRADREICGDGYNLNTFIMAEDFPSEWDNWDVDADIEMKFEDVSKLVSREVVSKRLRCARYPQQVCDKRQIDRYAGYDILCGQRRGALRHRHGLAG